MYVLLWVCEAVWLVGLRRWFGWLHLVVGLVFSGVWFIFAGFCGVLWCCDGLFWWVCMVVCFVVCCLNLDCDVFML